MVLEPESWITPWMSVFLFFSHHTMCNLLFFLLYTYVFNWKSVSIHISQSVFVALYKVHINICHRVTRAVANPPSNLAPSHKNETITLR